MADRNLTYKLKFEADVQSLNKLKSELDQLQFQLNKQLSGDNKKLLSKESEAQLLSTKKSVIEIKNVLKNAFNEDLGVTNVTKFNAELKKLNLNKIYNDFNSLGAAGRNAFRDIAMQATNTNLELKKTSQFIDKLGETLANSIRWTVTSSAIQSVTGSVERAYTYVKKLDTSLNNIRIVSGQSADQMSRFAKEANAAAQALGTTTTAYTDAALLYYQQGLSADEVAKRTETTLKMANVLGESADQVSSYMTAIWNNFDNGSHSLEYFGDVITALGASTASSAAEISQGLSQFAAVSNTVGLSYEYATSALATVVAATRQSADSVGTAFKTIFSRIQGLKLGETLDDGTSLNKYSQALMSAGVNIKDNNGQLKEMDTILEEMAAKWETLNQDQKMALAQTVAGTRQYTYLISLMDNWDSMTKNINTATDATGELNKQQEIYNDSLRARLNELQTAKDALTAEFFDSDSFKELISGLTSVTNFMEEFVKAIGGGGAALKTLGNIATMVMSKQIAKGLSNVITNAKNSVYNFNQLKTAMESISTLQLGKDIDMDKILEAKGKINSLSGILTEEQVKQGNQEIDNLLTLTKERDVLKEKEDILIRMANTQFGEDFKEGEGEGAYNFAINNDEFIEKLESLQFHANSTKKEVSKIFNDLSDSVTSSISNTSLDENLGKIEHSYDELYKKTKQNSQLINSLTKEQSEQLGNYWEKVEKLGDTPSKREERIEALREFGQYYEQIMSEIESDTSRTVEYVSSDVKKFSDDFDGEIEKARGSLKRFTDDITLTQKIQFGVQALNNISLMINSLDMLRNSFQAVSKDASSGNIASFYSSIGTGLGSIIQSALLGEKLLKGVTIAGKALSGAAAGVIGIIVSAILSLAIPALIKFIFREDEATRKTKELSKAVDNAKDSFGRLNSQLNDLTEDLSHFSDGVNALNELTAGTEEWNAALEKVNNNVLELINKYPELKKALIVKNGEYGFDIPKVQEVINQLDQGANFAERESLYLANALEDRKYENKKQDLYNEFGYDTVNKLFSSFEEGALTEDLIAKIIKENAIANAHDINSHGVAVNYDYSQDAQRVYDSILSLKRYESTKEEIEKNTNKAIGLNYLESRPDLEFKNASGYAKDKIIETIEKEYAAALDRTKEINVDDDNERIDAFLKYKYGEGATWEGEKILIDGKEQGDSYSVAAMKEAVKYFEAEQDKIFADSVKNKVDAYKKFMEPLINNKKLSSNTKSIIEKAYFGDKNIDFGAATDEEVLAARDFYLKSRGLDNAPDQIKYEVLKNDSSYKQFNEALTEENKKERAYKRNLEEEAKYQMALEADAKSLNITTEALDSYTKMVQKNNKELENDKIAAESFAKANIQFAQNYDIFAKSFGDNIELLEEWKEALNEGSDASVNSVIALGEVQKSLSNLFNVDISADFIKDNFDLINELYEGETKNLGALQKNAAKDFMSSIRNAFNGENLTDEIKSKFDNLSSYINNLDLDSIKIGAEIEDKQIIDDLNALIDSSAITAEQAEKYLNSIGYEPVFEENEATTSTPPTTMVANTTFYPQNGKPTTGRLEIKTDGLKTTTPVFGFANVGVPQKKKIVTANGKTTTTSLGNSISQNSGGKGNSSKNEDPIKDSVDRYHDVNLELKAISNQMSLLEKQKSKLVGGKLIENLNAQMSLLNKQIEKTNEKIRIANGEAAELRGYLSKNNVSFSSDGSISNYAQIVKAREDTLNALIDEYNKASDKRKEKLKDDLDEAKKEFEEFKQKISRYDEVTSDMLPSLIADIEDAYNKEIEINITKFNASIELQLDLQTAEKQWNNFKKRIIDEFSADSILGNVGETFDNFRTYYGEGGDRGTIQALTEKVTTIMREREKMSRGEANIYGNNEKALMDDLLKYTTELQNHLLSAKEALEAIKKMEAQAVQSVADSLSKMNDIFEKSTQHLQHSVNLIKLIKGENAFDELLEYSKKQQAIYEEQINLIPTNIEYFKKIMDESAPGSEEWETARQNWYNQIELLYSSVEAAVQHAQEQLKLSIEKIFDETEKALAGASFDYATEEWDLLNKNADRYLDTINATYGIQKLQNKVLKSLAETDNVAAQKQLQGILNNELATLQAMDKVSQYDLDRANKKYELALKEIALREAEQNKSKMRLRRDSSGNYSYQFVADEDKISDVRQEIEDLNNEIYNLDKNQFIANQNEYVAIWKEYRQKLEEAALINDPEEKARQMELIQRQYEEALNNIASDNLKIRNNLYESSFAELNRMNIGSINAFYDLSNAEKDIVIGQILPQWDTAIGNMIKTVSGEGGFANVCATVFNKVGESIGVYNTNIEKLDKLSGGVLTKTKEGYDGIVSALGDQNYALLVETNQRADEYNAIEKVVSALQDYVNGCKEAESAAKAAASAGQEMWTAFQKKAIAETANQGSNISQNSGASTIDTTTVTNTSTIDTTTVTNTSSDDDELDKKLVKKDPPWKVTYPDGSSTVFDGKSKAKAAAELYCQNNAACRYFIEESARLITIRRYQILKDAKLAKCHFAVKSTSGKTQVITAANEKDALDAAKNMGFDTGGYTGSWGSEGKLAFLHEKELVLNKEDTQNILNTVNIVRALNDKFNASIGNMMSGFDRINSNGGTITNNSSNDSSIEQQVYITANFTGETTADEIRLALNNLMNVASQKVNSTKR